MHRSGARQRLQLWTTAPGAGEPPVPVVMPGRWRAALVRWARRNEDVREVWLFGQSDEGSDAVSIGVVLASADGNHARTLGDFSLLDAKWRSELRAITRRQVRLEPMVPGYPGDRTIRSIGTCLWKRPPQRQNRT